MKMITDEKKLEKPITPAVIIPFFITVCLIPVITLRIPVLHHEEMRRVLVKMQGYEDTFYLGKVLFLYLAVVIFYLVFLFAKDINTQFPRVFLFFIPYSLLVILSVFFSKYRISALFGIADHYEGAFTQLCYCCIGVFSYYLTSRTSAVKVVLKLMLGASVFVALIGFIQYRGILPADSPYTVSSTLGNSNTAGTYAVLLLPCAVALVWVETVFYKKLIYFFVFLGSSVFLLFGSMSRAGYLSFIIVIPLFLLSLRKEVKKHYKGFLAGVLYMGLLFLLMNTFSKGLLINEWKDLNPFLKNTADTKLVFEEIHAEDTGAIIQTDRWTLGVENGGEGFTFYDENGNRLFYQKSPENDIIYFTDKRYFGVMGLMQSREAFHWLILNMEGKELEFVKTDDFMKIVGYNGVLTDIEPVESYGFKGWESFASGRGYIWSRALPLLKKAFWLGYGPDTFVYFFPQNDIVGKLNYGAIWVIISNPHSWYLQVALGSGMVSLLCLLVIIAGFMVQMVQFLRSNAAAPENVEKGILCCGMLCSVIGFCVTGIFNDSVVAVSPVFWVLLGMGLGITSQHDKNLTAGGWFY